MTVFEELQRRGLLAQLTDEEEIKELINEGKLIRPAYRYVGHHRAYKKLEERD